MAISVSGGHVQRALDFYNKVGKYFVIGGTEAWADESSPDIPSVSDYRLRDIVGFKRVENCYLVVPDDQGTISYRTQSWRIVPDKFLTTLSATLITGSSELSVANTSGISVGSKLRINNEYEGVIVSIQSNTVLTLDTPAPSDIPAGSTVLGGALVEDARYVYIDCYLNYDQFPIVTYRQIGLCTEVTPNTENVLRSAAYTTNNVDEYSSVGVLEILDNRSPSTRDIDQKELLSIVLEF